MGDFVLDYVLFNESVSSVIPIGADQRSYPGGGSWVPIYYGPSFQVSLGRFMI